MSIIGKYVRTFAKASHALPDRMHMNADYPYMLPPIVKLTDTHVTIRGRGGQTAEAKIHRKGDREYFDLAQSSTFETIYGRKPTKFRFYPFKDEDTPAICRDHSLFPAALKVEPADLLLKKKRGAK